MSTERTITVPEDVTASIDHLDVTVEGPNGSVTRRLWYPDISVGIDDGDVTIASEVSDAKTNATVGTFESHVRNMIDGVTDGWEYEMEVFYSHFPMQVSVQDGSVVIENFIGEREPRRVPIHGDTQVTVDGEELTVSGPSIEDVGQTAADIEQQTRVSGKDTRVFQDGVYITNEPERGNA